MTSIAFKLSSAMDQVFRKNEHDPSPFWMHLKQAVENPESAPLNVEYYAAALYFLAIPIEVAKTKPEATISLYGFLEILEQILEKDTIVDDNVLQYFRILEAELIERAAANAEAAQDKH